MATIDVIHFKVGHGPGQLVKVENELSDLQALVGGPLELVRMKFGLVLLCHEEGILRNLPIGYAASTLIGIIPVRGDFFVCRVDGSEFASVMVKDSRQVLSEIIPI